MANVGNDDFDPAEEFTNSLAQFGFSQPAQAAITANGLQTTQDLIGLSDKDIDNIMKIVRASTVPPMTVSYMAQKRLTVMCYWVNRRHRLGEYTGAEDFTPDIADAFSQLMTFESQEEEQTNVKPPSEFKPGSKWRTFKEGAIAFFNFIRGCHNIPLAYVIRSQEDPDPDIVYETEHQRLIAITPHQGLEFSDDNGKVFDYLKSWTLNGPAWTWMRSFNRTRNGRAAWLALLTHFEGDAQRDRAKDAAYAAISNAKYYGEKKRFSFETYVTIHQEAYEDLEQYGEPISEDK